MRKTVDQRFWEKVGKTDFCWLWKAGQNGDGYGTFWDGLKMVLAHRYSYKLANPKWDEQSILDHLKCDNPLCVNPEHVKPSTHLRNLRRSPKTRTSINRAKTHCPEGHRYSRENTSLDNGSRRCKECKRIRERKRTLKKKEAKERER